jgi:hypothetical protein
MIPVTIRRAWRFTFCLTLATCDESAMSARLRHPCEGTSSISIRPWWVKSPKLRPLYDWIRRLHENDLRLPVMVVTDWVKSVPMARVAEREQICAHLSCGMPLLNVEQQLLGQQLLLSYGYSQHDFREKGHLRQCS